MWYVIWPVAPLIFMAVGYLQVHLAGLHIESLQRTRATIIETGIEVHGEMEYSGNRDFGGDYQQVYYPKIRFSYTALGKHYDTGVYSFSPSSHRYETRSQAQGSLLLYRKGNTYPAWFDPDAPDRAVLHRGSKWKHMEMLYWSCVVFLAIPMVQYKSILRWFEPKETADG